MRHLTSPSLLLLLILSFAPSAHAETFFADVPRNHWAWPAINQCVDAGFMPGHIPFFHGETVLDRYAAAACVSRLLDAMNMTLRPNLAGPDGLCTRATLRAQLRSLSGRVDALEVGRRDFSHLVARHVPVERCSSAIAGTLHLLSADAQR